MNSDIKYILAELPSSSIYVRKSYFTERCFIGCPVYNRKWSCPPRSPIYIPTTPTITIVILYKYNNIIAKQEFTKIKALNSILKSYLNKLLYQYPNTSVFGSGSCRLCKKCNYPNPCHHPNKMLYSCESVGIDVSSICQSLNHPLQWYEREHKYKYGTVVGIINDTKINVEEKLIRILS